MPWLVYLCSLGQNKRAGQGLSWHSPQGGQSGGVPDFPRPASYQRPCVSLSGEGVAIARGGLSLEGA